MLPVPRGDWQVVEHTHEPLVSHGLFQLAAYGRRHRQCRAKGAFENRFAGLAFCGDCGRAMSTVSTRRRGAVANLACGGYKAGGRAACTNHFIDYEELCQVVCRLLRDALHLSQGEREKLLADAEESRRRQQEGPGQPRRKAVQIQISRLEQAIRTLYGDRVQGYLRPERMAALLENYERELDRWRAVLAALPTRPEEENPIPQALAQLEKRLEGGDPPWDLLRILVEEIQIFQGRYERQGETLVKRQSIRIRLRFQGQNTERTVTIG